MKIPHEMTSEEQGRYEREGEAKAEEAFYMLNQTFTDGLGAMGVGSYEDGPASIRQAAFNSRLLELMREWVNEARRVA